jgi:Transglutaminase-like superfamily
MSVPMAVTGRGTLPPRQRVPALFAVGAARLLARLSPRRIRSALCLLRRGAAPATYEQTLAAREAVVTVSVLCAGEGCLQRSLATAVLCRMRGTWPTWCTGVRTPPFKAHAWVEVDGQPIGEPQGAGYYRPIMSVPPR